MSLQGIAVQCTGGYSRDVTATSTVCKSPYGMTQGTLGVPDQAQDQGLHPIGTSIDWDQGSQVYVLTRIGTLSTTIWPGLTTANHPKVPPLDFTEVMDDQRLNNTLPAYICSYNILDDTV